MKRLVCMVLTLLLVLSLSSPALAAEEADATDEIKITWLSVPGEPSNYIDELGWLELSNGFDYTYMDLATGAMQEYDYVDSFSEGLARVGKGDSDWNMKLGYINTSGEVVIPLQYDFAVNFSEGLAWVGKRDADWNMKYGYINTVGEVVVPLEYDDASDFSDGMAMVGKRDADGNWKYGYINTSGEVVIPLQYGNSGDFSDGLTWTVKNGKYGYINTSGEIVVPFEYDCNHFTFYAAVNFSEGLARVSKYDANGNMKYGYINTSGEVVVPLEYNDAAVNFSEGLAFVGKRDADGNWKYGYINTSGEVVIPLQYDFAVNFSEGLACVRKRDADGNRKSGYINTSGEIVIPLQYDEASVFSEGLAWVAESWKHGFINTDGDVVVPLEYYDAGYLGSSRYCWVNKGTSYGIFENPYYTEPDSETDSGHSGPSPVIFVVIGLIIVATAVAAVILMKQKASRGKAPVTVLPGESPAPNAPPAFKPAGAASGPNYCPNCGAKLEPGVKFCPNCGKAIK